jgi:hypothetical protein
VGAYCLCLRSDLCCAGQWCARPVGQHCSHQCRRGGSVSRSIHRRSYVCTGAPWLDGPSQARPCDHTSQRMPPLACRIFWSGRGGCTSCARSQQDWRCLPEKEATATDLCAWLAAPLLRCKLGQAHACKAWDVG